MHVGVSNFAAMPISAGEVPGVGTGPPSTVGGLAPTVSLPRSACDSLELVTPDVLYDSVLAQDSPGDMGQVDVWRVEQYDGDMVWVHRLFDPSDHVGLDVSKQDARRLVKTDYIAGLEPNISEIARQRRWFGSHAVVGFERDPRQKVVEREIEIPILRIHCPKTQGSVASETFTTSGTSKVHGTISVTGINASSHATAELTLESGWETRDGECLELLVPAVLRAEFGWTLLGGERRAFGMRVNVVGIGEGASQQRAVPPERDGCEQRAASVEPARRLADQPIVVSAGTHRWSTSIERSTRLAGEVSLPLGILGQTVSLGLGYSRTFSARLKRDYVLNTSEDAAYLPYCRDGVTAGPGAVDEVHWTTK